MNLPIRAFWLLNSSATRLMAESDIRSLTVASSSESTESIHKTREHLVVEMGHVIKIDPIAGAVRDEAGFQALRAMSK